MRQDTKGSSRHSPWRKEGAHHTRGASIKARDFELKLVLQTTETIDLVEEFDQVDVSRADMLAVGLVVDDTAARRKDDESLRSE